jgi:hypothetical protein
MPWIWFFGVSRPTKLFIRFPRCSHDTCKLTWNGVRPCLLRQIRMLFSSKQQRWAEQPRTKYSNKRCEKVDFLIDCLLPLAHSPWAFIQTQLNWLLFHYNSYFQTTSRLQKLLSLSLTQLGLYLNLIPSTTQTPCLDLLGSGSYLILISSPTRIHIINFLNWTCISLMLRVYIGILSETMKISSAYPTPYLATLPEFLPDCLPERLTRSGYSYPALPDLLTRPGNSLSALSRNLLPKLKACQC